MAFEFNPFTGSLDSVGLSQASADARYVLKVAGSFSGLTGAGFRDTSAAFDVTLGFTSSEALTAARSLTLDVVNASRSIKLAGNVDLGGNFTTTGSGTLALGGFTLTVPATGTAALLGTANVFTAAQTLPAGLVSATALNFGTAGTGFYSSAAATLLDAAIAGVKRFTISATGTTTVGNSTANAFALSQTATNPGYGIGYNNSGYGTWYHNSAAILMIGAGGTGALVNANTPLGFSSAMDGTITSCFFSKAAATIQMGLDAAGVTNQMFTAASRITSDGPGADLKFAGGNGRGGAGGSLIFSYYTTAAALTIGTLTEAMRITTTGAIILAALPTSDPGVSGQLYKSAGVVMQSA